jgi:hypothetical protein
MDTMSELDGTPSHWLKDGREANTIEALHNALVKLQEHRTTGSVEDLDQAVEQGLKAYVLWRERLPETERVDA